MQILLIFVKNNIPGQVKTRIAASVGDRKASQVYDFLQQYTCQLVKSLGVKVHVYYSDHVEENDLWSFQGVEKFVQKGENLGERMYNAFQDTFDKGARQVVIIGSDCAQLMRFHIRGAFELLGKNDVVVGPAEDGGYYLLGMKELHEGIFKGMPWSSAELMDKTKEYLDSEGLSSYLMEMLADVDHWEDWQRDERHVMENLDDE